MCGAWGSQWRPNFYAYAGMGPACCNLKETRRQKKFSKLIFFRLPDNLCLLNRCHFSDSSPATLQLTLSPLECLWVSAISAVHDQTERHGADKLPDNSMYVVWEIPCPRVAQSSSPDAITCTPRPAHPPPPLPLFRSWHRRGGLPDEVRRAARVCHASAESEVYQGLAGGAGCSGRVSVLCEAEIGFN